MIKFVEAGIRVCICCEWSFVSPDPERIRRCIDCKLKEEPYERRVARLGDISDAVRPLLGDRDG